MTPRPKYLGWHLLGINRRHTGPSRWRAVGEIAAFVLGGLIFAALIYAFTIAVMFAGSVVTGGTSNVQRPTSNVQ